MPNPIQVVLSDNLTSLNTKQSYEATITLIPKPDENTTKRKLQANTTNEHRYKNPPQNTSKPNATIH